MVKLTVETHTQMIKFICKIFYIWYRPATPPPPPPAMVMVPRVGCTISLESNYHARYLCFPAPPCGVWGGCSMYVPT